LQKSTKYYININKIYCKKCKNMVLYMCKEDKKYQVQFNTGKSKVMSDKLDLA